MKSPVSGIRPKRFRYIQDLCITQPSRQNIMPGGTTGLRPPRPALPSFRAELAVCRGLYS